MCNRDGESVESLVYGYSRGRHHVHPKLIVGWRGECGNGRSFRGKIDGGTF